jgi:sec-independent protein translocase protein TatA
MPLLAPGIGPLGLPELLIIAFIVILIFGVGRLPEVGGAVGKSIKEFRKSTKDVDDDDAPVAQSAEPAAVGAAAGGTATTSVGATTVAAPAAPVEATPPPVTAEGETRFCSECGAKNARAAKFCAECGNTMAATAR